MEFEFDKEMDSLLRQTAKSDFLFPKQNASAVHIDADEISMFAENALPEKAKPRVMKHLADCDRCRTVLSNVIFLNSEAEEVAVPVTKTNAETIVASTEPNWFQKLFSTRNLAFGMGALAVIFAVGIGFIIVQNISNGNGDLAKVTSEENQAMDKRQSESMPQSSANSNASSTDNELNEGIVEKDSIAENTEKSIDSNSTVNKPSEDAADVVSDKKESVKKKEKTGNEGFAGNTPKPTTLGDRSRDNIVSGETSEELSKSMDDDETDSAAVERKPRSDSPAKPKQIPPTSPVTTRSGVVKDRRSEEKRDVQGGLNAESKKLSPKRQIKGKTFNRKNGVWTDSAYKGQRTTKVKRNTTQYRNLDTGLQSIGNQLNGTVVVVWKSKAYEIQ